MRRRKSSEVNEKHTPWGRINHLFLFYWLIASSVPVGTFVVFDSFEFGWISWIGIAMGALILLLAARLEGARWRSPTPFFIIGTLGAAWVAFLSLRTSYPNARGDLPSPEVVGLTLAAIIGWGLVCRFVARAARRREWDDRDFAHCAKCGYSLRGLNVGRCPECGTRFDAAPPAP